jgi:hypothetical protein
VERSHCTVVITSQLQMQLFISHKMYKKEYVWVQAIPGNLLLEFVNVFHISQ